MIQNKKFLKNYKNIIQLALDKKEQSLFVFDIDSTLFCMKHRTQAIIRDCVKDKDFSKLYPEYLSIIKKVEVTDKDWSIEEILSRYGFKEKESIVLAIRKFWWKKFLTNEYLHLDQPYKTCVKFIKHITNSKAKVFYLTARRKSTMYEGTVKSLNQWGFPLENPEQLIMKTNSEISDLHYKTNQLLDLSKRFKSILFFENEPVILNAVAKALPNIQLFWIDSTHSQKEKPPKNAFPLTPNFFW